MYRKFKLCQCPKCGTVRITTATKIFKCNNCGKQRVFISKRNIIGNNVKVLCSSDIWKVTHEVLKSIRSGELEFIRYGVGKQ